MGSALAACCLLGLLLAAPAPTPTPRPRAPATAVPKPSRPPTPKPTLTPLPTPTPAPTETPTPTPDARLARVSLIGLSWEGRPINAYALGTGTIPVAIVGGMHGAPEANSSWLVWQLLDYYQSSPEAIPPDLSLLFVPEANPDGLAEGMRELADGVDANRNWPTPDWSPTSYGPGGTLLPGGGGPTPLSEPETAALAAWILQVQPAMVLSYHSAGGLVMGGSAALNLGLVDAYLVGARGYMYREWIYYPVTGDFAQWLDSLAIPTIEVELWDHFDPDLERNLPAVQNVLVAIETILATDPSY